MYSAPIELFQKSPPETHGSQILTYEARPGVDISLVIAILFLPILLLIFIPVRCLLGIAIPYTYVRGWRQKRRERKFTSEMAAAGRFLTWDQFEKLLGSSTEGTIIIEWFSLKGPVRTWWTPEGVPIPTAYKEYGRGGGIPSDDPELIPFFDWCRSTFTDPQGGTAKLVEVPLEKRAEHKELMKGKPRILIYSGQRYLSKTNRTTLSGDR